MTTRKKVLLVLALIAILFSMVMCATSESVMRNDPVRATKDAVHAQNRATDIEQNNRIRDSVKTVEAGW